MCHTSPTLNVIIYVENLEILLFHFAIRKDYICPFLVVFVQTIPERNFFALIFMCSNLTFKNRWVCSSTPDNFRSWLFNKRPHTSQEVRNSSTRTKTLTFRLLFFIIMAIKTVMSARGASDTCLLVVALETDSSCVTVIYCARDIVG